MFGYILYNPHLMKLIFESSVTFHFFPTISLQQESRRENHEFDEILTNYYRACKKLMSAENVLRNQQESHKKFCKDMWETVQEHIVVQVSLITSVISW